MDDIQGKRHTVNEGHEKTHVLEIRLFVFVVSATCESVFYIGAVFVTIAILRVMFRYVITMGE